MAAVVGDITCGYSGGFSASVSALAPWVAKPLSSPGVPKPWVI